MSDNPDNQNSQGPDFSHFDALHLGGVERDIDAGKYVSRAVLEEALHKHGDRPVPTKIQEYKKRLLAGEVPKPRGRRPTPIVEIQRRELLVAGYYRDCLQYFQRRSRQYGKPAGWTKLDMTPGEIAARIVAKLFLSGSESWKTAQNIASGRPKI